MQTVKTIIIVTALIATSILCLYWYFKTTDNDIMHKRYYIYAIALNTAMLTLFYTSTHFQLNWFQIFAESCLRIALLILMLLDIIGLIDNIHSDEAIPDYIVFMRTLFIFACTFALSFLL